MQRRSRDPRLAPRPPGAAPPLAPLRPGSCKAGSSRFSGAAPRPHPWLSAAAGLWGQSIRGAAQSLQRPLAASPGPCTCPPWTTPTLPRGSRLSAGFPQGAAACPQEPKVTQTTPRVPTRSRVHLPKLLAGPRLTGSESTVKPGGRGQAGARRQLPGAPRCPSRPCCAPSATSTIRSSELGSLKGSWSPPGVQLEVPRAGGPQTCGWRRTPLSAGGAHGVRTDLRRETLSWSRRAGVSPPRDLSRGKGAVLPDPPFQGHSRRTRRQDPNPPAHSPGLPRPSGGAETHTVSASRAGSGLDLSAHRFPHLQARTCSTPPSAVATPPASAVSLGSHRAARRLPLPLDHVVFFQVRISTSIIFFLFSEPCGP